MAQSVLATILYYTMQVTYIPNGVCEAIDRRIQNFICGSKEGERKVNFVKWEDVTRSKDQGGLGIWKMKDMNTAFLAKIGWRMETEPDTLWGQVIATKYAGGEPGMHGIKEKRGASNLWRGICESK